MFTLVCTTHGETLSVPCGRWRECSGCAARLGWKLYLRFLAGIEQVEAPRQANFFTLTFPASDAPDEDGAHEALRSLVRRLRYRDLLGTYGWVLQRQNNGSLHYHGIAHMPWMSDGLKEWRGLLAASGFGTQHNLKRAQPVHAHYCARYISRSLATVARLRRAYSFSPTFPKPRDRRNDVLSEEAEAILRSFGVEDDTTEHTWEPAQGLLY